jgi:16S rRNA (cytosine967-C5)-methyltransferase
MLSLSKHELAMEHNYSPKIFPNTVAGVIEALELAFGKNLYADKVVEKLLRRNKKWGSRDRAFVAEHTYEIVRNWRLLWALTGKSASLKRKDLEKLFGIYWLWRGYALPEWPKFDAVREVHISEALAELPQHVAILESYPDWFAAQAEQELGDSWPEIARALNLPAAVVLRTNALKTNPNELVDVLREEGIAATHLSNFPLAIQLEKRPKLTQLASFKNGLFEVQDAGSQTIAPFLQAKPGEFVIDACAGAGGKTLQLAAEMVNKGTLIAMDISEYKLKELEKRTQRNGVDIVQTALIKSPASIKAFAGKADKLLLDVPCSGSGVIRRDVDTKWKLQPEHVERNIAIQRDILHNYTQMLKPGGTLVYATCSIFKSENEDQVQWFLEQHPEYKLEDEKRLNPGKDNDGFYMARMKKNG